MPLWLQNLIAQTVAYTALQIAENMDVVISAFKRASTATLTDATPDPRRLEALRKEQSGAVHDHVLPPDNVR